MSVDDDRHTHTSLQFEADRVKMLNDFEVNLFQEFNGLWHDPT